MAASGEGAGRPRPEHVPALDGLRGLAALIVVVRHTMNAVAMPLDVRRAVLQSPLAVVLDSEGAVQLFFVLSGYVLAGSLTRSARAVDLLQYCVRRIFRIHPPYVAAVLFAWGLGFVYARTPISDAITPLQRVFMSLHLTASDLLATLWFPGSARAQLPVGWTLQVEMLQSFLLPLLMLVARFGRGLPLLALAGVLATIDGPPVWLRHTLDFALGVVTFREPDTLARAVARLGKVAGLLFPAALLVHAAPLLLGWLEPRLGTLVMQEVGASFMMMSLGAWGLVTAALLRPWPRRLLSTAPVLHLGRTSYSLYLVHLAVLHAVIWLWRPEARFTAPEGGALLAVVLAISVPLAWAGWRFVERPAILVGNRVSRALARRMATRPLPSARADD